MTKTYIFSGKNSAGTKIEDEIQANSIQVAKVMLRRRGIQISKLKEKSMFSSSKKKKAKKIKAEDIASFTRQVCTMSAAGVPLIQALTIIITGTTNISLSMMVTGLKTDLEAGLSFSEALANQPLYFDDLYCNLVKSGEQSGSLDTMLDRIATYKEKSESLKRKIKKAMYYPIAIVVVAMIVSVILLVKVVPTFEDLFAGFGAELPAFTVMVLNLSRGFQAHWFKIFIALGGAVYGFLYFYKRNKRFRDRIAILSLKAPVFGTIFHKACVARFSRTLATTFSAGVPLNDSLIFVSKATGNILYENAVLQIRDDISSGQHMQSSMSRTNLFPHMVVQMIAIGEESGNLEEMLTKVANIYEEEVDLAVDGLTSLLEPLIMVFLGIVVGGLVIAMYLPIFQLGSAI